MTGPVPVTDRSQIKRRRQNIFDMLRGRDGYRRSPRAPREDGAEPTASPLQPETTVAASRNLAARSAFTMRKRLARRCRAGPRRRPPAGSGCPLPSSSFPRRPVMTAAASAVEAILPDPQRVTIFPTR